MKTNTYTMSWSGAQGRTRRFDHIQTSIFTTKIVTSNYQLSLPNIGVWSIKQSTFRLKIIDISLNQLSFFVRK